MTDEEVARQLEIYLEKLNESLKDCNDRLLLTLEAQKIFNETVKKVKEILPKNTRQYKIFDREVQEQFQWWLGRPSGYVNKKNDCGKFVQLINTLQKVLSSYQPEFIQGDQGKTEFYFSKGNAYDAKTRVFDTMKQSENSLIIIDSYAGQDTEILKYIASLKERKESLKVQVLTEKVTPIFEEQYKELMKEKGNIEVKKIKNVLHDRYLIIDQSEIWTLGISINRIGEKDFSMTKFTDKESKSQIIKDFNEHWANAKSLDDKNQQA